MHLGLKEAEQLVHQLKNSCDTEEIEVAVCPAFTALFSVARVLKDSKIGIGAQDVFWEDQGAFTGEISPGMLLDVGCRYVIIGHSERRLHLGESDLMVHRKLLASLKHKLIPILCIGETLLEREANRTFDVLTRQLEAAFGGCSLTDGLELIIAYEPVWAIGTGWNASPQQAQEAHRFIRRWISEHLGTAVAASIRIQYGGSVNAANAASLLQQSQVDGALVGGASLKAEAFAQIVKAALDTKTIAR